MASIVFPFPGRARQRPLPFPRTPRLVTPSERALPWAVASLLFVTAVLNFYIFQVSVVATSSYELQRLERDRDAWRAQNEQLSLELAKARSLGWVEFQAIDRLGMVRVQDALYIRLSAAPPAAPARLAAAQPVLNPSSPAQDEEDDAPVIETAPAEAELASEPGPGSGSILAWLTSLLER